METPLKPRSNRPLTQFACRKLTGFLLGEVYHSGKAQSGNTTAQFDFQDGSEKLTILLFSEPILTVCCTNWKAREVTVSFTSFYDGEGQPSTTTMERLNGLLDCLGRFHIIPQGVRVFRDRFQGLTYLGRGDDKVAVGRDFATSVSINVDKNVAGLFSDRWVCAS